MGRCALAGLSAPHLTPQNLGFIAARKRGDSLTASALYGRAS
jgi:hypothetical protein